MAHRKLELQCIGHGTSADNAHNSARSAAWLIRAVTLSFFAFIVAALPFATLALAQLPAADKAAFYRMRKQAIERSLQNWRQSTMPGAAKEIARLQREERDIDAKLNQRTPRPLGGVCAGCPAKDPDWCGLNCTMR